MSLVINTSTPEGLVIAADSRQSYRNRKGISRIGSDTARKLFQVNTRIGVAITGLAYLNDNGVLKNSSSIIKEFIEENDVEELKVNEFAKQLYEKYKEKDDIEKELSALEQRVKNDLTNQGYKDINIKRTKIGIEFSFKTTREETKKGTANLEQINFLVAGFNKDNSHEVYICYLPGGIQKKRDSKTKNLEYGANWLGQTDLVNRIIKGFDPRIFNIKSINQLTNTISIEQLNSEFGYLEYSIQWGTMTLQDAVDFSDLMIKTTSAIQNYSDGIQGEPGDMPGVGGEVDIAVLTKKNGFTWLNKKGIKYKDNKIDIE